MTGNMTWSDYLAAVEERLAWRWGASTDCENRAYVANCYRQGIHPDDCLSDSLVFKYGLVTLTFEKFREEVERLLETRCGFGADHVPHCTLDGAWRNEETPEEFVESCIHDLDCRSALRPRDLAFEL